MYLENTKISSQLREMQSDVPSLLSFPTCPQVTLCCSILVILESEQKQD